MTQGFVTIATGNERYYKMARNLLRSYRQSCQTPMPFAIICDRENQYTQEFDKAVILPNATRSWKDKLALLTTFPFDENIFLDADCLIYRDINCFWDIFSTEDDFSCFGKALPMDATTGWFTKQAAEVYPIQFITHLHGILYFVRKSETAQEMNRLCQDICANYDKVRYKIFDNRIADEPVYAMAMAIMGLKPKVRKNEHYCFVPAALWVKSDYYNHNVTYAYEDCGVVENCYIVHWGNRNTMTTPYRMDAYVVNLLHKNPNAVVRFSGLRRMWYRICDFFRPKLEYIAFLWGVLCRKIGLTPKK